MKKILTLVFLIFYLESHSQDLIKISNIPTNLSEGVDAVIRLDETEFYIESIGKSVTKRHWIVSIFNQKGEDKLATFSASYDKFSKIRNINGTLYDAYGKSLKTLKSNEIQDIGMGVFGNDITDNRIKIAEFGKKNYAFPYTVEFKYEIEDTNMLFYTNWSPISYEDVSIQTHRFKVLFPEEIKFRKKEIGNLPKVVIAKEGKYNTETWELTNQNAYHVEEFSKAENQPQVYLAPIDFTVDGYTGQINSWEDLSKFYYSLNQNRDELSIEIKEKLKDLVKDIKDDYTKTKMVYEFMQSRTRYLSVQLGIGGWQSTKAIEVSKNGYGDCKALTNFTIAMLKEVGIKAHPVLIHAGAENKFSMEDFPSMRFNHVIACVPMQKDTIWLECTDQKNPFGYQGDFTGNRKGLLIKENGGKLINTLRYDAKHNLQNRSTKIVIDETGNAQINVITEYSGIQSDSKTYMYESKNNTEQKEWLLNKIGIPSFELASIKAEIKKNKIPLLVEELHINAEKYSSKSGNRLFFKPNVMTRFFGNPKKTETRETDIYLNPNEYSFKDTDNSEFLVPAGYKIEFIPKEINEKNIFGEFTSKCIFENGKIKFYRNVEMNGGIYPKEHYDKLIDFIKMVNKSDQQKIVMVKE